jgi:hypothetical protein
MSNNREVHNLEEGIGGKVETWEKMWGYVALEEEFENERQKPPGVQKGPKKLLKKEKKEISVLCPL